MSDSPFQQRPLSEEARHLAAVQGLQRDYDEAMQTFERLKAETAGQKKLAEAKARAMHKFVRALNEPMPLFEVWKQTPVAAIGLPDGVVMLLEEAGYDTVGKIGDYTAKGGQLTDLPHIGEAKAQAIADALERFWHEHKAEGEV